VVAPATVPGVGEGIETAVRLLLVLGAFLTLPLLVGQAEHKAMAHMQARLGPMYAGGFHGWAQLVADGVKFAQKEDIVPLGADRRVFALAPAVALIPYLVVLLVIPIGPGGQVGQALDLGLFFALAVMGVGIIGTLMAGWASANKFSLLGAVRTAAQLLAYELPLILAASSAAMAAGTLSLSGIAEAWEPWWLLWQAPAAFVFFVAGLAELHRPPFDMPVADSEIIFGAYTEYTGLRFALFILAEYAGIVVLCGLTTVLFLGGWRGPFLDTQLGWLWTLAKCALLVFLVIWARVSYPRLREDQLQRLAWVGLVPLALAQLALTGVVVVQMG
jgi:NADH-quinone oxidoreductase subunit H